MTLQVLVDPVAEAVLQRRDDHLDCGELKFKKRPLFYFRFCVFFCLMMGRHCTVDPPVLTFLWPRVRIPAKLYFIDIKYLYKKYHVRFGFRFVQVNAFSQYGKAFMIPIRNDWWFKSTQVTD